MKYQVDDIRSRLDKDPQPSIFISDNRDSQLEKLLKLQQVQLGSLDRLSKST